MGREEVTALGARVQAIKEETKKKKEESWKCEGPGCEIILREKKEWRKQKIKRLGKTFYYCLRCWESQNVNR